MSELFGNTHLELLDRQITSWLMSMMERNDTIVAVDRGEPDEHRWYVRMHVKKKSSPLCGSHLASAHFSSKRM